MTLHPIAVYHTRLSSKFGLPRQSGLAPLLEGEVELLPEYSHPDYIRGLEGFVYIWLLWEFSANKNATVRSTVRPPLLGGNKSLGVLATRSPYRPNPIGLSSMRLTHIEQLPGRIILHVAGADLMDGTPVFDIKPYVEYADSHVGVRSGFVDQHPWRCLDVVFADEEACPMSDADKETLRQLLSLDPRPHYHDEPSRIYGMTFQGYDVKFRVEEGRLIVLEMVTAPQNG